ncbi:MAG: multidrug ABC transporter ATP-binding protein [Ignavibacteriales bacterium CG12_big_fil_rev_8_21_14_0_65_30_8]|nr:MAG: multidrug ABC transporter ATP-binding protein [Ignavibacteriales bacterium CG12_big_fil_rev_8_21_14_0_65_30_8]
MQPIIKIEKLSKSFGDIKAVNKISFDVAKAQMFGLVGPDGAGKSTIIRILTGLLSYDNGSIKILDMDLKKNKKKIQDNIGYLSQKFSLYGDLTIDENIEFFAKIHGVSNYEGRRNELLKFTRLTEFRDRLADNLSGGMKQKLALVCSLIHKPKILYLDEPTTGVDPVSRRDFWKILANLLKDGVTIFMSTPYLDEAERCNKVALINKGKIISIDSPEKIKESTNKTALEIVCNDVKNAASIIKNNTELEIQLFGDRMDIISNNYKDDYIQIEKILSDNSIEIISHRNKTLSLENVFILKVKNENVEA